MYDIMYDIMYDSMIYYMMSYMMLYICHRHPGPILTVYDAVPLQQPIFPWHSALMHRWQAWHP